MAEDNTLFGTGHYPRTGPLAILARLAYISAALAIILAVLLPPERVPDFIYSHNLQHFAAFYVLMLCAVAALPAQALSQVTGIHVVFATGLETLHLIAGAPERAVFDAWAADLGGVFAALAPMVADRFRRRQLNRRACDPTAQDHASR